MFILYDSFNKRTLSRHRTYGAALKASERVIDEYKRWKRLGKAQLEIMREMGSGCVQRVSSEEQDRMNVLYGKSY